MHFLGKFYTEVAEAVAVVAAAAAAVASAGIHSYRLGIIKN